MVERLAPNPVVAALGERVRRDGSRPLLTYVELDSGGRLDLSATTVANWVGKVSWALDEDGLMAGDDAVAFDLIRSRPTHWSTPVWALGVWSAGGCLDVAADPTRDIGVTGPDGSARWPVTYVLSCSLWGTRLPQVPPGATDGADVLGQPDAWRAEAVHPTAVALTGADPLTHAELGEIEPSGQRRLIVPGQDPLRAVAGALLGGGSLVLVDSIPTPEVALRIAEAERATA